MEWMKELTKHYW